MDTETETETNSHYELVFALTYALDTPAGRRSCTMRPPRCRSAVRWASARPY